MTGRARGRGVARGRGAPAAQQGAGDGRRPGTGGPPPGLPQQAAQAPAPSNGNGNGAGRAAVRGGARGDTRPGAGVVGVQTQMAQMSLGTGTTGEEKRGRRQYTFTELKTKPAHISDKRGATGKPTKLLCNYFKLNSRPDWVLYQYHVDFNPPIDSRKLRKGLLSEHKKLFNMYIFDGAQLFTAVKLDQVTEVFSVRLHDGAKIRLTIKLTNELPPNNHQSLQIFNIMMRQMLEELGMKEVQRNFFDPNQKIMVPNHKLEVWPGFNTSIQQFEESILLNLDISHKILRTDTVLDHLYALYNRCRGNVSQFHDTAVRELVGTIVMTRYNDKTYRVDDIEWNVFPTSTFKRREDEITYMEYYKVAHSITVRDDKQPMLVSRPKKKDQRPGAPEILYLLPELCTMTGLSEEMRKNFTVMKDLGAHTRLDPSKRCGRMMEFRKKIEQNAVCQEKMRGWGLKFSADLVQLNGRVLPEEKITMGTGRDGAPKSTNAGWKADWGPALRECLYTTVPLNNWMVVYHGRDENAVNNMLQTLNRVGFGMTIRRPQMVALPQDSTSAYLEAIRNNVTPQTQMVMAILSTNKKDRYDAIKKQCCIETPVPSQCVTMKNVSKNNMSVVSKICIQLNCKLGGEAWAVEVPIKNSMVIGYDTYHDSAKKGRSVAGIVCSLNQTFTRYYSQCVTLSNMEELVQGLCPVLIAALKKYYEINNCLPTRIIIYRDGVGDGQLPAVFEYECPQIIKAFEQLDAGWSKSVKVGFIVVKKRISARFFAAEQRGMKNPPPGTVVDSVATKVEFYDFYLVSQSVGQGTVSPTHYNIIHDSLGLQPDHLQRLSYKLCHLYYNWPGTIRVPAPCQYAHKLAFLVGQSVHKHPDLALADKLYYL